MPAPGVIKFLNTNYGPWAKNQMISYNFLVQIEIILVQMTPKFDQEQLLERYTANSHGSGKMVMVQDKAR